MSIWQIRSAGSADWPGIGHLLPSFELETANLGDDEGSDQLLLASPVAADGRVGAARGCLHIRRDIGLDQPRYWYHIGYRVHAAAELGMFRRERTLLLGNDHTGAMELAGFALDESALSAAQRALLARLLVAAGMLLLRRDWQVRGEDPGAAAARIIATLPGRRDRTGTSPFWQGLGRHFYPGEPSLAAARFGASWLTHVAALLPRHPLVVSILPPDTQAAIGGIDPAAEPLRQTLLEAGLRAGQHIDVYDGGPVYEAPLDLLDQMAPLRRYTLQNARAEVADASTLLACDSGPLAWWLPAARRADGSLGISAEHRELAGLALGDSLWAA